MLSQKLQDALNDQINKEVFSEYLYLSMAAFSHTHDMDGIANFFHVQAQEEHFHAMKIFNFIIDRGGTVQLKALDAPKTDFKSFIEVFDEQLKHEQFVTKSINNLADMAIKESDHALLSFLKWYIDEQVEEEATASKILNRVKMVDGKGEGLMLIDTELAARVFTPPPAK